MFPFDVPLRLAWNPGGCDPDDGRLPPFQSGKIGWSCSLDLRSGSSVDCFACIRFEAQVSLVFRLDASETLYTDVFTQTSFSR